MSQIHSDSSIGVQKMTYWVQNLSRDLQHVGKHIKSTKKVYTWDFDVRMSDNSYIKEGGLDKKWRSIKVVVIDSTVSKKRTVKVND